MGHAYIYIYKYMVCNTLSSIGAVDIGYTPIQDDVFTESHVAKRREEERRSKKRKSQKKEDPGANTGSKVAKHCVEK